MKRLRDNRLTTEDCNLPKLKVAGSNPVSRSKKILTAVMAVRIFSRSPLRRAKEGLRHSQALFI